jgi:TetR/AcrR family transcriptional regulator of autoinduction and epiphytic fitness
VYVHFDDLEDLFAAAARRQFERILPLLEPPPTDGPLSARLAELVTHRVRVLEASANVRRAAQLQEPFSAALTEVANIARKAGRDEIERTLATELDRRRGVARRRLLAALDAAASASTWDLLRRHDGLDVAEARAVVTTMLTALLASE